VRRRRLQRALRRHLLRALRATRLDGPALRHVLPRVRATATRFRASRTVEERALLELEAELRPLMATRGHVVVGPWLSEIGFEVLYWIPFLRWVVERLEIPADRLVAMSRGGVPHWYRGICASYVDILDLVEVDEFRSRAFRRWRSEGGQKQFDVGRWDRQILRRAADRLPGRDVSLLHPSLMYRFFAPYWRGEVPLSHVTEHARYAPLPYPDPDEQLSKRLPSGEYVAAKFYFRPSFPDDQPNRRAVQNLIAKLERQHEVVLLNTGLSLDDHVDFDVGPGVRLSRPLRGMPPERNLLAQDIAISRAEAFHGTYGGLSYVAALRGVASIAYYSHRQHFASRHLDAARDAAAAAGGRIELVDVNAMSSQ
jgi:hypothetical protein